MGDRTYPDLEFTGASQFSMKVLRNFFDDWWTNPQTESMRLKLIKSFPTPYNRALPSDSFKSVEDDAATAYSVKH